MSKQATKEASQARRKPFAVQVAIQLLHSTQKKVLRDPAHGGREAKDLVCSACQSFQEFLGAGFRPQYVNSWDPSRPRDTNIAPFGGVFGCDTISQTSCANGCRVLFISFDGDTHFQLAQEEKWFSPQGNVLLFQETKRDRSDPGRPWHAVLCLQTRHACPQTAWDATHSESMSNLHGGSLVSGPSIRCVTLSMLWVMDMCKCPRTTAAGTLLKSLPKCLLASKAPACRSIHLIEILAPKSGIRLQNPIGCRMEHTLWK